MSKVASLVVAAVLLGVALSTAEHGHLFIAGALAMGSSTAAFLAGMLLAYEQAPKGKKTP